MSKSIPIFGVLLLLGMAGSWVAYTGEKTVEKEGITLVDAKKDQVEKIVYTSPDLDVPPDGPCAPDVPHAADRDLTLVCGKAKLTLRFDGRIELNGTNILSASRGPHRIKGATVAIN